MAVKLKKLSEQVMVITGASSGIGLATARSAAKKGVRLVLAARTKETLEKVAAEIQGQGGEAIAVAGDVASEADVRKIAQAAIERFGGFDTWINDAGVSIYGRLEEVSADDHKRLFDTNYWGVVNGSLVAAEHLRRRGGAIINIGSVLSERSIPLQGAYCASKHAVKGFTEALRMELEHEGAPISVTLIKPSAVDTPYKEHARNYLSVEPENPPPVYAPEVVVRAILHSAQHPMRDVTVGGGGRVLTAMGHQMPRLTDRVMEATLFRAQRTDRPKSAGRRDGLFEGAGDGRVRGGYGGMVREHSVYTEARLHPLATVAAMAVGAAALGAAVWGVMTAREEPTVRRRMMRAAGPVLRRVGRVAGRIA